MKIKMITQAPFGTIISLDESPEKAVGLFLSNGDNAIRIKGCSSEVWTEILIDKTDVFRVGDNVDIISASTG